MLQDTVNGWTDEGVFTGGYSFGDGQVSEDVTRRYVRSLADGTFAVIEESYAVIDRAETYGEDGMNPEFRFLVEERIEYAVSADKDDPFNSAVWQDVEYGEGSYLAYTNIEDAEREAHRMAQDHRDFFLWSGEMQ